MLEEHGLELKDIDGSEQKEGIPFNGKTGEITKLKKAFAEFKGSPREALSTIYDKFGFGEFNKKRLYSSRIKEELPEEISYKESTVDLEVRILKKLGLLISVPQKPGVYRLSSALEGNTPKETSQNIAVIYNMKFRIGNKEVPLDRYEIPLDRMSAVKARVQMELMHMYHKRALTARKQTEKAVIKLWEGYLAPSQENMTSAIRNAAEKSNYEIELDEDIDTLITNACNEKDAGNIVTILPSNKLSEEQRETLRKANAHVLYMDFPDSMLALDAYEVVQIEGIIAAAVAYLNNDETSFKNLYKLLTDNDNDENIKFTIAQLKEDPALAIDLIFQLKPIKIQEYDDLTRLNTQLKQFLQSA